MYDDEIEDEIEKNTCPNCGADETSMNIYGSICFCEECGEAQTKVSTKALDNIIDRLLNYKYQPEIIRD